MEAFSISSTVKSYPKLPYQHIKEAVAGKRYQVSLVFVGPDRAQSLNITTRGKDYVPNVLSFELDQSAGEIYICPAAAKKEAAKFSLTYQGYIGFLFIHGLLHLKGLDHGPKMEALEQKYLKQLNLS